jgi:hypothetical protein
LFTDVAGFADPVRTDSDRDVVRAVMYEILRSAFEASGVPWAACYREDRGDGAVIVVPPTISTQRVVDPLVAELADRLRQWRASRAFVIAGVGGLGKSTVALNAARMARERGYRVWWVHAADTARLTSGMLEVLRELGAPESVTVPVREGARTASARAWEFLNGDHAAGRKWPIPAVSRRVSCPAASAGSPFAHWSTFAGYRQALDGVELPAALMDIEEQGRASTRPSSAAGTCRWTRSRPRAARRPARCCWCCPASRRPRRSPPGCCNCRRSRRCSPTGPARKKKMGPNGVGCALACKVSRAPG